MAYGNIAKKIMQAVTRPKGKKYPGGVESPPLPKVRNPIRVKPAVRSPKGTKPENPLSRMNDAALKEFGRTAIK